jgi:hypothetical protein
MDHSLACPSLVGPSLVGPSLVGPSLACPSLACPSLACPSLVSRSLPCRALLIIREYSQPLTRHNWRQLKSFITPYQLYLKVQYDIFSKYKLLHHIVLYNIYETDWFYAYQYIKYYGLPLYMRESLNKNILYMDGIEDATHYYLMTNLKDE